MTAYNNELRELREKLTRKNKLEKMLSSLNSEIVQLKKEESRLRECAEKEQADVNRLEKISLTSLLYSAVNKKAEKLDKEKAEAYAAAVKLETKVRQIEDAERQISALDAELQSLADIESEYDQVFENKTAAIKHSSPEFAEKIIRIEERRDFIAAQERELGEAVSAGNAALSLISDIEAELDDAHGWGTFDLLGGGLISDLAKHSHLDKAQDLIYDLQISLNRYRTELADVQIQTDVQVQIDGFMRFADFFFDGIFADYAVLDKIKGSQEQVSCVRSQIENTQKSLENIKAGLNTESKSLNAELEKIVLTGI